MKKIIPITAIVIACMLFAGCAEEPSKDTDNDGVEDKNDDFPDNPQISKDSDGDGYADEYNKGYNASNSNASIDAFPQDPTEWKDSDGDGYGDERDDFPYNDNLHSIIRVEEKSYTIDQGGEINVDVELSEEDKSVIIYWELEGDSFTKRAGEAITMRYKADNGWSKQFHGRTYQKVVDIQDGNVDRMNIRFVHEGRSLNPPFTSAIDIQYSITKTR